LGDASFLNRHFPGVEAYDDDSNMMHVADVHRGAVVSGATGEADGNSASHSPVVRPLHYSQRAEAAR